MNRPAAPLSGLHALARRALAFAGLGVLLYALLAAATEQLVRSTGHGNPFFKIATMESPVVDWVVLGTSHAMPLDFGGTRQDLQRRTGQLVVNLAATGTGPLYNRFVLEQFLAGHRARNLLVVVDSFAFHSATWNEERFADAKLLARTPFDPVLAARLWQFVRHDGVPPRAWLDYATSFSKINNRDRFKEDRWEGEDQFDGVWRPSVSAVKKRMQYLYPDGTAPAARERYLRELSRIIAAAGRAGVRVVVVKLPTTAQYRSQLPDEPGFDAALARGLANAGVPFHDFSAALPEPRFYFDSDHLNRAGVNELLARHLLPLLTANAADRNGL
jgi:hypothetical protein